MQSWVFQKLAKIFLFKIFSYFEIGTIIIIGGSNRNVRNGHGCKPQMCHVRHNQAALRA